MPDIIDAHGGITEFYQAARKKYDYSEYLNSNPAPPNPKERAAWLVVLHEHLLLLHYAQLMSKKFIFAIQTRYLIEELLNEMKDRLDIKD